jgi:hypothetical protein
MGGSSRRGRAWALVFTGMVAWGGGAGNVGAQQALLPPLLAGDRVGAGWQFNGLPDQPMPRTRYDSVLLDGQRALRVEAQGSYGHLVHDLPPSTTPAAGQLVWRWRLDRANARADLRQKAGDDVALKVCASFDLPLAQVPFVERQLLRLARSRTGQALPAATVCYVWDPALPAGTVLDNAYSRRLRMVVVRGQGDALGAWTDERRDVAADLRRLFGEELGPVLPALTAVAVSADADNTGADSLAHVAAVGWQR